MARVSCPKCKLTFSTKDDSRPTAQCPDCGTRFPVGGSKGPPPPPQRDRADAEDRAPRKKGGGLLIVLVGLLTLCLVGVGGGGFAVWHFFLRKKDDKPPVVANNDDNPRLDGNKPTLLMGGAELKKEQIYNKLLPATVLILTPDGSGSGVLVARDPNLVITNHHVVGNNASVTVFFPDIALNGEPNIEMSYYLKNEPTLGIRGRVIERNPGKDMAIVHLERIPESAHPIPLAANSAKRLESVVGIGASGAKRDSLWQPHSGDVRQVVQTPSITGNLCWFLFTQQPTNPGDSGGPIVNNHVELVAIVQGGPRKLVKNVKNTKGQTLVDQKGNPILEVTGDDNVAYNVDIRELRDFLTHTYGTHFGGDFPTAAPLVDVGAIAPSDQEKNFTVGDYIQILRENTDAEARVAVSRLAHFRGQAVQPLIDFLGDDKATRRHHFALEALEKIGAPIADPGLEAGRKALKSSEPPARIAAAKYLASLNTAARKANVVPDLIQAVSFENTSHGPLRAACEQAVLKLGPYGDSDHDKIVGKGVDPDPYVRGLRAKLVVEMEIPQGDKVRIMDRYFKDDHVHVRAEAIRAVGKPDKFPRGDIYRLVIPFLGDKDYIVRSAAFESLYKIPRTEVSDLDVLKPFFKSDSAETHLYLLDRVASLGERATPIVPEISKSLNFPDDRIKLVAIDVVLKIGRSLTSLKDDLVKLSEYKERPDLRVDALRCLAIIGKDEPGVLRAVFERLDDSESVRRKPRSVNELRAGAIEALKEKVRQVFDLPPFDLEAPPVWYFALTTLNEMLPFKSEAHVNDIKYLLNPDKTRPIVPRAMAAKAIAESGSAAKVAIEDITKALKDPDLRDLVVRKNLCKAAGNCGQQGSPASSELARMATYQITEDEARKIGPIVTLLHRELRDTALTALKQVGAGASAAVPALREILRSSSATPAMLTDAIETLGSIGDQAAPAVPELLNMFKTEKDYEAILNGSAPRSKLILDAVKKIGPTGIGPIQDYLHKYEKDFLDGRPAFGKEVEKFVGCLECYMILNPGLVPDKEKAAMAKDMRFLRSQADLRKYQPISRRISELIVILEGKK